MQTVIWVFIWLMMAYLIGQLAYRKGRQDKWEEMSSDYICIHKSVCVSPNDKKTREKRREKRLEKTQKRAKKTLDKKHKKRYNKTSYGKPNPARRTS